MIADFPQQARGIDAPVLRGQSTNRPGSIGREGVLIGERGDAVLLGLRHESGDILLATLDTATVDRLAHKLAEIFERQARRAATANDQ